MRPLPLSLVITLVPLALTTACAAQRPSPGAELLFAKDDGGLSVADQNVIFESLGMAVDSAGTGFTMCDQPAGAVASFSDWNKDGIKEVLVIFGNTCTSGMAGSSVALFIKDSARAGYSTNLGFPGASADPQPTSNLGYPDLLSEGPGSASRSGGGTGRNTSTWRTCHRGLGGATTNNLGPGLRGSGLAGGLLRLVLRACSSRPLRAAVAPGDAN